MLLDEIEALVSAKIAGANVEAEAADATGATGIADTTCETGSTGVMDTTGATGTSDVTDTIEPTGAAAADDETAAEQAIAIGAAPATVLTLPVLAEAGDAFILNSMANVQIISQAAEGDYEYAITYELVLDGTVISTVVRQLQNLKTGSKVRTNLEVLFMTWSNTPGPGAHVYEIRIGVTGILLASASVLTRAFNMTVDSP